MKLYYWKAQPNFGDLLNPYIWPKLFPNFFDETSSSIFLGIGSVIWPNMSNNDHHKHVFGSGWDGIKLPTIDDKWHFHFVRGPHTARHLGLEPSLGITDPAILVHGFEHSGKSYPISLMPHCSHDTPTLQAVCRQKGIHYISPLNEDVESVMRQIASSEIVLAEAMHGAIVADALRVPWHPIEILPVNHFKWSDWCASLELQYRPQAYFKRDLLSVLKKVIYRFPGLEKLYFSLLLNQLTQREIKPTLSEDRTFQLRLDQVWEQVHQFRKSFAS